MSLRSRHSHKPSKFLVMTSSCFHCLVSLPLTVLTSHSDDTVTRWPRLKVPFLDPLSYFVYGVLIGWVPHFPDLINTGLIVLSNQLPTRVLTIEGTVKVERRQDSVSGVCVSVSIFGPGTWDRVMPNSLHWLFDGCRRCGTRSLGSEGTKEEENGRFMFFISSRAWGCDRSL